MENTVTLNVIIPPSREVESAAFEMSEKITSKIPSHFKLDTKLFLPHISLYHARYPKSNINALLDTLSSFASSTQSFEIVMQSFALVFGTFIGWDCNKTSQLQNLHESTINRVNALRNGYPLKEKADSGLNDEDEETIKKYGTIRIFENYTPHITLARSIETITQEDVFEIIGKEKRMTFMADTIAVGHLKEHGTVTNILGKFSLKNSPPSE